ncbi:MAG TPA: FecR domain-containing protein [Phenylobacterium sp.]|jgi:transmembrane sensor|nr:FecR domain-containing protein [Phenylobacterium sp.]
MSEMATERSRADNEAAGWFARLNQLSVTTESLWAFREWRRDPANREAYARTEAAWDAAGRHMDDPEIRAMTAEALARNPVRPDRAHSRQGLRPAILLASAAVTCAAAVVVIWTLGLTQPTYRTGVGEQRLVVLQDGSRVRLNTDSELRVRFRASERRVVLARGEAFFEAAHNPARPFVVEADGARVRALGTRFDVRRDARAVQVTLLEGRVQVGPADHPAAATLAPNQQLTVSGRGVTTPVAADASEISSWTTGRLSFRDEALGDALAEVNRYAVHKVSLDGPAAIGRQPVSGVFNVGDTPAFVAAVCAYFDLEATTAPDGSVRLAPRARSSDG